MSAHLSETLASIIKADMYVSESPLPVELPAPVVTISRSFGANGTEIARRLAEKLQVPLYDQNLLTELMKRTHVDRCLLEKIDEKKSSPMEEAIYSFFGKSGVSNSEMFHYLTGIVAHVCHAGGVIIGRGAHLLTGQRPVFRLRLEGSSPVCARRVMQSLNVSEIEARQLIKKKNEEREKFVKSLYQRHTGVRHYYDMGLNTDLFEPDQVVRLVVSVMKRKGFRIPESALEGMSRFERQISRTPSAEQEPLAFLQGGEDLAFHPGEFIFRQGDIAHQFYLIREGSVELLMNAPEFQDQVAVLEPGEMIGVAPLFIPDKTQLYSARALTSTRLQALDDGMFTVRLREDPAMAFRLLKHMAQEIRALDQDRFRLLRGYFRDTWPGADLAQPISAVHPAGQVSSIFDFHAESHRILVVEDDSEYFELLRIWLERTSDASKSVLPTNFWIDRASSFQEAVEYLANGLSYAVILLDLNLPDSHGLATFEHLYRVHPDLPYVILTGLDDEPLAIRAMQQGAQDYLVKTGVDRRQLILALRYAMERFYRASGRLSRVEVKG